MGIFFKPEGLTDFFKIESDDYEIYCVDEEYESGGSLTVEKTAADEIDEEIYEKLTGESLLQESDLPYYKEDVPKLIRVKESEVEKLPKNLDAYYYEPIETTPTLFTEIAKIEYFNLPSLKKFIENFGLPFGTDLFQLDPYSVFHYEMDLFEFYDWLYVYKKTLNVFESIQSGDEDKIEQCAKEFENYVQEKTNDTYSDTVHTLMDLKQNEIMKKLIPYQNAEIYSAKRYELFKKEAFQLAYRPMLAEEWLSMVDAPPKTKATRFLIELLNESPKGDSIYTLVNNQVHPGYTFSNLFEVAFFQLSRAVIGNIEMRHCENCGALFEANHGSQKFCPPLPGRKISTCQNTFNQRQKRTRKKAKNLSINGYSIAEISKKLKRDPNEIKEWLNS